MSYTNHTFRFTFLLIISSFFYGETKAQSAENMTLLGQWNQNPTDTSFYKDLWGYVDEQGNEYAIVGSRSAIHFLDVTVPENPVLLDEFFMDEWSESRDFKRYKDYIYAVGSEDNSGLRIFDMSALPSGSILQVSEYATHFSTAKNIFIDHANARLYVAGTDMRADGLLVFDLTQASTPVLLADVPLPRGGVKQVYVRHDIAYCIHDTGEMFAYDLSNPINPVVTFIAQNEGNKTACWLSETGKILAYTDNSGGQSLGLLFVGETFYNPLPTISTFHAPLLAPEHSDNLAANIYMVGDHIFVAHYEDGVVVFDNSNLGNVLRIAYFDTYENTEYHGAFGCTEVYPFFPSGNILALDIINGLYVLATDFKVNNLCNNTFQDENEIGVDCGGICASCLQPTCDDGIQNGIETDVDCGGNCLPCCLLEDTPCDDGDPETFDDIEDGQCNCIGSPGSITNCGDGIQNGSETGIDCGGVNCPPCESCISYGNSTNNEYIDRVVFNTINNLSGNDDGYADFTNYFTVVNLGETYTIELYTGYAGNTGTQHWKVWVDTNLDGNFAGADELVFSGSDINEVTGEITIPTSLIGAFPKMRVQMKYNTPTANGCQIFLYGEVEDYALIVEGVVTCDDELQNGDEQGVDCGGTFCEPCCPYIGTFCDDNNPLTYNDLEDGNCNCIGTECLPDGTPCDDDNSATENDIFDENCLCNGTECPPVGTPCDDENPNTENDITDGLCSCAGRLIATCDDGIQNGNEIGIDCGGDCSACFYCDSHAINSDNKYISQVGFNTLNNTSGNDGGYGDFTDLNTPISADSTYSIYLTPSIINGEISKLYWRVWIDFSRDGDFWDANEMIYEGYGENTLTGNITIPTSVLEGQTRMRVQMQKENYTRGGCAIYEHGEVEDYTVNIE